MLFVIVQQNAAGNLTRTGGIRREEIWRHRQINLLMSKL